MSGDAQQTAKAVERAKELMRRKAAELLRAQAAANQEREQAQSAEVDRLRRELERLRTLNAGGSPPEDATPAAAQPM